MKLAFIIPAKNEEKRIANCILSVHRAMEGFVDYEIIVVDNDSTDKTKFLANLEGAYVVSCPFDNIAKVRNFGAKHSSGDWLVFVDADSSISKELLSLIDWSDRCIGGGSKLIVEEDSLMARIICSLWNTLCHKKKWFTGSFIFVDKFWFERIKGFDEKLYICEDIDFSNKLNFYAQDFKKLTQYIEFAGVKTSARKLSLFTFREHFEFWLDVLLNFNSVITSRSRCFLWYNIRR